MSQVHGQDTSGFQRVMKVLTDGSLYVFSTLAAAMDTVNDWLKIKVVDNLFEAEAPTVGTTVTSAGEVVLASLECSGWKALVPYVHNTGAVALNHIYVDISPNATNWFPYIDDTTGVAAGEMASLPIADLEALRGGGFRYVRVRASTASSSTTVTAYMDRCK